MIAAVESELSCYLGYARAQQFKRARREVWRLRIHLRRVTRQIERGRPPAEGPRGALLTVASRILVQKRENASKVHSMRAREME